MISFHPNTQDVNIHSIYSKNFRQANDNGSPNFVGGKIVSFVTSPIVWIDGVRRGNNFAFADWLVLDFDEGMSLEEALEKFGKYTHVIGTTKSHGKPKGKDCVVCDRFRVWLKLEDRIEVLEDFTYTTKFYASMHRADAQAIDGARKFLPCREIVSVGQGSLLKGKRKPKQIKRPVEYYSNLPIKFIPKFIQNILATGAPTGSRNYTCFTVAKYLASNGFSEGEILAKILESPLGEELPRREIEDAVRNGGKAKMQRS